MQKIRGLAQKLIFKGNVELKALISEEGDICKKEEQLCKERAEAIAALKAFAASQPDDVKSAVNEIAEQIQALNQAENEKIASIKSAYIAKLEELLETAKKMDALQKQQDDAKKAVEKAIDNISKKQKGLDGAKTKGDAGKIATAEVQLKTAEQEKTACETKLEKLTPEIEAKMKEFQTYQGSALKDALKARSETYKVYAEKYVEISSGLAKKVAEIPAEEGVKPPVVEGEAPKE
jgi:DNA-directed RNA polymerase subunit F